MSESDVACSGACMHSTLPAKYNNEQTVLTIFLPVSLNSIS